MSLHQLVPKLQPGNEANDPFGNHYPVILSVIPRHSREFTSCMVGAGEDGAGTGIFYPDSGAQDYAGGHQG